MYRNDDLRIRLRLYFTNAIGELIAGGLIEPGLAHMGKVTASFQKLRWNGQSVRYLDTTGGEATSEERKRALSNYKHCGETVTARTYTRSQLDATCSEV
jgi:hypothetical protein